MVSKPTHIAKARREVSKCQVAYEKALKEDNRANREVEKVRSSYTTLSFLGVNAMKKKRALDKMLKAKQSVRNRTNKRMADCLEKLIEAQRILDGVR